MKYTFTQNELLLKKLYGELEPTEEQALDGALASNYSLYEDYQTLKMGKDLLDGEKPLSPSQSSIELIMMYSDMTKPMESVC